jgi:hypothetical protein
VVRPTSTRGTASFASALFIAALTTSCGGGSAPAALSEPRVEIAVRKPAKTLLIREPAMNLVRAILPLPGGTEFLVVGSNRVCRVSLSGSKSECHDLGVELWNLEVLTNDDGSPAAIVGSRGFGSPSAAVLDVNGQLKWKHDGGYGGMGRAAVLDSPAGRFVVSPDSKRGLLYFDFASGKEVRAGTARSVMASADFTGDGRRDVLLSPNEGEFLVLNGEDKEVASLRVSKDYWYEPAVTMSDPPFVVLSAGSVLDVYHSRLTLAKRFDAAGAASPLHVVAAAFVGSGPDAPFAVVYSGRGGWHRSVLYYFARDGKLVYKEILGDDYQSVTPLAGSEGTAFLVGGRGEVWLYRF